ncbi:hypothetical protein COBT_002034, partial [Conglomerata obtusa]
MNKAPTIILSFAEFIRQDGKSSIQRSKIINLHERNKVLLAENIQNKPKPEKLTTKALNYPLSKDYLKSSYKLEQLKLKIIDNVFNFKSDLKYLSRAMRESKRVALIVFLLILKEKDFFKELKNIVKLGFDVNRPIFNITILPSYYFIATALKEDNTCIKGDILYSWHGIPAYLFNKHIASAIFSVIPVSQYKLLMDIQIIFENIHNDQILTKKRKLLFDKIIYYYENELSYIDDEDEYEKGLYILDLAAMKRNKEFIKQVPENLRFSTYSYLIQSDTLLSLVLYSFEQELTQTYKMKTPLHIASEFGNIALIAIYIEAGLDIDAQDKNGNTALHLAAYDGNNFCYDYLMKKNHQDLKRNDFIPANEIIPNLEGKTSLEIKKKNNMKEVDANLQAFLQMFHMYKKEIEAKEKYSSLKKTFFDFTWRVIYSSKVINKIETIAIQKEKTYKTFESYVYFNSLIYPNIQGNTS